jgi:hypothetical protein
VSTLDVAQANGTANPGATGSGSATMTFDTDTKLFSWNITFAGVHNPETAAHFHVGDTNTPLGPITITLALGSPKVDDATLTAQQESDLLAELFYINIHTTHSPSGEIRGQVLAA